MSPPKKKFKRLVKFNNTWLKNYAWIMSVQNEHQAYCKFCRCNISISHGGENDLKKHEKTIKHSQFVKNQSKRISTITSYIPLSTEEDQVSTAETAFIYHTVKHAHSYNSAECAGTLFHLLFPDSKLALKYRCCRKKATKIVSNVLAPYSIKQVLDDLKNNRPFSIATDASNKENIKTFPFLARYLKKRCR